jgi:hypothetical protein
VTSSWSCGEMDIASAYGAEDWEFDPPQDLGNPTTSFWFSLQTRISETLDLVYVPVQRRRRRHGFCIARGVFDWTMQLLGVSAICIRAFTSTCRAVHNTTRRHNRLVLDNTCCTKAHAATAVSPHRSPFFPKATYIAHIYCTLAPNLVSLRRQ